MSEREKIASRMASIIPKYVMFFVVTLTCNGDNTLRMYSPNKEYEFCINRTLDESSGSVLSEFSICDKDHKVLQNLDKTEFPVIGAKWHKSSNAIIIVEHISRQVVIMLVNRQKDRWKISEVSQFKNPPGYFQLVEAISTDIAFRCYYLGHDMGSGDWDALCTDIDIMSGEAALKSSDKVAPEKMPFYKMPIAGVFYQLRKFSQSDQSFQSTLDELEPAWFSERKK